MRNRSSTDSRDYRLNRVSRQINLLCLGEFNCSFTSFLMQYTGQFQNQNQIHNIYVKRLEDKVVFLHEWKKQQQLQLIQQFDGLVFFVDLVHHLNNTTENILKNLETLSKMTGINVFRIPMTVIALNKSKLNDNELDLQKKRLQKSLQSILEPDQILYYSRGKIDNFKTISSQLSIFVDGIFDNDPKSIKQTWISSWKLYGTVNILQPYWTEMRVFYLAMIERLVGKDLKIKNRERIKQFINSQPLLKKLW